MSIVNEKQVYNFITYSTIISASSSVLGKKYAYVNHYKFIIFHVQPILTCHPSLSLPEPPATATPHFGYGTPRFLCPLFT